MMQKLNCHVSLF